MNWKKVIGILVAIAAVAYIGYAIIFAGQEEETLTVRVDNAREESISETLSLSGLIEPSQVQEVFGQGIVSDLPVAVNDTVSEGDLIIAFDGVNVTADFNGTVTEVNASEGEPDLGSQTGTPAVTVSNLDKLEVAIQLTQTDAPLVEVDQPVTLTSGDQTYAGTVSQVDPVATTTQSATGNTQSLNAVISFDETPEELIAGFDIDAEITTASAENALTIPIEALLYNSDNEPYVYIVENDTAQFTPVELGIQSTTKVEILSGLSADQLVILSPSEDVRDGAEIAAQEIE